MVSHELIVELQQILFEEYDIQLSYAEAKAIAEAIVQAYGILLDTSSLPVTSSK
jgi:hypothetical protein